MVLKLPSLFIICFFVYLTAVAQSLETYIIIHKSLDWNNSINTCSSIGGRTPSFSEVNNKVSMTKAFKHYDHYWILSHQEHTTYSYQGCFNASKIEFNITEVATHSIGECLDACVHTEYFAISTNSCICIQDTSYLEFEHNCSALCQNDSNKINGSSEHYMIFQRSDNMIHGSSFNSCINEISGDELMESCNVIFDKYLCENAYPEQTQNVQCAAYNASGPIYRNCSDLLPSLCAIEDTGVDISDNEESWTSARNKCKSENGHLINPEHFSKHIILSKLWNSSEYYWVDSKMLENETTETEFSMDSDAVTGCENMTPGNFSMSGYNGTVSNVTNCTTDNTLTPKNCTALRIEGVELEIEILRCERLLRYLCEIDMESTTADQVSSSATSTKTAIKSDSVTTDSTDSAASTTTRTTTEKHIFISHAVYGLIGGIVAVVLILSIVCVVFCVIFRKYKDQQRELSMLKGPTISYSNLEHSDFNSSVKAALADNNSDDDDSKTNETDADHDLVARIVIRDDNSDVKSLDPYSYCDVVDEKLNEKPMTANNNVLNQQTSDSIEKKGTVHEETDGVYSLASTPEVDNIYQNETEFVDTSNNTAEKDAVKDGDEVYRNHRSVTSIKDIQNHSDEHDNRNRKDEANKPKIDDELYSNSEVSGEDYSELAKQGTEVKTDTKNSEYDHVKLNLDDYDHLDQSHRGAVKTKPVVVHYEDVELP